MNRIRTVLIVIFAAAALSAAEGGSRTFGFKKEDVGKMPAGWKAARTGEGEGSVWKVVADDTAPSGSGLVLAQTAAGAGRLFNLCVVEDASVKDVEVAVAFKAVQGDKDQGGGVVWRYRDADNYYIARMNPLEDNFRVYKVVAGKRIQLATREDRKVRPGEWHTIQVRQVGKQIDCRLDGTKHLEVSDDTFAGPGKVGLWTKADAQTHFDGFTVRDLGK